MSMSHMQDGAGGTPIVLENLWKTYASFVAVSGIDLSVGAGQFCTVLGPSGSGKTTTLMMIAGFVAPTRGRILVSGRDIAALPPQKRDLGVVFQNYALFPHMTVFDNVAFPLVMRRVPQAEIAQRVARMLETVELAGLGKRYPRELSGGQQQRVALARALVFEPRVLLMDEPLGALDKKLRSSLQIELKALQRRLDVTVIYVTHDQEEALTMADQIVVMQGGRIEQSGSPEDLYDRPATAFVAGFMGDTNLVRGVVMATHADGTLRIDHPTGRRIIARANGFQAGDHVAASLRPESLSIESNDGADEPENAWEGRIAAVTYLGDAIRYHVAVGENRPALMETLVVKAARQSMEHRRFAEGDAVRVRWSRADARILPPAAAGGH
ncbi:Spermidine/putrescine import ATP-binding protein PotA [Hyphomicrobiales bacterium]|nr:Spermidine/putrescine import ATP-binding protein PotA [Hyphomicrobiales bacterium]CAH1685508.1 Spermidine/putrescine import ATP-binding protein PotA [Hyphomicrobiales bacterium]